METKAKKGPAELETARMAAVLSASYPKGWRFKAWCVAGYGTRWYQAYAGIERFDGVYWNGVKWLCGARSSEKDGAFRSMLAAWASKDGWTETAWKTALPWPPASSTEELCLKLSLLEDAG